MASNSNTYDGEETRIPYFSLDNIEDIKKELQEVGRVVIDHVISDEDCDRLKEEYKMWVRNFGEKMNFGNIRSIIHKYGVAHMAPTWEVRLKVKKVFAALWETEKLLSSMDGIAIGIPPESSRNTFEEEKRHSLHLDQGPTKEGLHAYQGAVYLENADYDDWCFKVMKGSHHHHKSFFKQFPPNKYSEFRPLSDDEVDWYLERDCKIERVPVEKGGIVLWDSRLVHDGAPPKKDRKHPNRWRFVNFVSMTPAIWARPKDIEVKQMAYRDIRCTRHWSSIDSSVFREHKANPGIDLEELPDIAKTVAVRYLAGDLAYDFSDGTSNGPKGWKPKLIA